MSEDYSHEDIKELTDFQHIQKNPELYIGQTKSPTHLVYEALDNALDEAQAGYANLIGVVINTKDKTCIVSDNGRGIPMENDTIIKIATKLHTGGKFEKGEAGKAYKIAAGLHGIGLVAITALSEWVSIIVYRNGKKGTYKFKSSKVIDKTIEDKDGKDKPFSTQITFKPDAKFFESVDIEIKSIRERLRLASIHIPKLKLILIVDDNKEVINCTFPDYFKEELIGKKKAKTTPVFTINQNVKDEKLSIKFCWVLDEVTRRQSGCINLLKVDQGTHINKTHSFIRNVFTEMAKKEKLTFLPDDCLIGFRCHSSMVLYEPKYSSQTKEKLEVRPTALDHLYEGLDQKLVKALNSNPEIKCTLLARFEMYRKKLTSSKAVVKSGLNVNRYNNIIDSKLRDCTTHSVEKSELFITEGSSASGSLIQCRDTAYHAILGLKGKIPNIADVKTDALKNKEIVEIINALGTGVEPDFTLASVRYGKIIIATDADADGSHICTLLMIVFLRLVPRLLKEGYIYRAVMPLYGGMVGKVFKPLYTDAEVEVFKAKHPNSKLQRYKGLGEMNPDQLKVCLLDGTRRLQQITYPDNDSEILKLMLDASLKRTLL